MGRKSLCSLTSWNILNLSDQQHTVLIDHLPEDYVLSVQIIRWLGRYEELR